MIKTKAMALNGLRKVAQQVAMFKSKAAARKVARKLREHKAALAHATEIAALKTKL